MHHQIIGGSAVRLALCTRGMCENDCNVFKVACMLQRLLFSCNQMLHAQNVSFSMVAALISCDYNIYNSIINDYEKQNIINENLIITQQDLLCVLIPIKMFI